MTPQDILEDIEARVFGSGHCHSERGQCNGCAAHDDSVWLVTQLKEAWVELERYRKVGLFVTKPPEYGT